MKHKVILWSICVLGLAVSFGLKAKDGHKIEIIETKGGVKMVKIPAGSFMMGSDKGKADEKPAHEVTISAFYMDQTPITQKEYQRLMGANPSRWKEDTHPVESIRWSDCASYCNARSKEEGLDPCYDLKKWTCDFSKNGYRMPTEAEWEYACRAGTKGERFFAGKPKMLQLYAHYEKNSGKRTRPVGKKRPNPWGLYDMYGNVWEWCNDYYKADYYKNSPKVDPRGPEKPKENETRVLRGGCWSSPLEDCYSAARFKENPSYVDACFGYDIYGFRVVRPILKKKDKPEEKPKAPGKK